MKELTCLDLSKTYLQMKPDGKFKVWESKEFWESTKTGKGLESPFGFLVAQYQFKANWAHWERHPKGDELLIAVEGRMELVLEINGKQETILSCVLHE